MDSKKLKKKSLLIDPELADVYESPKPFRRFIKLLVDRERFPETPLTIAMVHYPSGARIPFHSHKRTTEVYFVLAGELVATVQGKRYALKRGQLLYIPPGAEHRAENPGGRPCRFMSINTPLAEDVTELRVRQTWKRVSGKMDRRC